jgi:hypothetical protein
MQLSTQSEINRKISRALLGRGQRELTQAEMFRLAKLIADFKRSVARRRQLNFEIECYLRSPPGASIVRAIVKEELDSKGN